VGYAKLFSSIVYSTIWQEEPHTKICWITMLAMADQSGHVMASIPGLAKSAGISLDQCLNALEVLSGPDPYSRTKDHEGRRIITIDGGWALLNYLKYRAIKSEEETREKNRVKVATWRAKQKVTVTNSGNCIPNVTGGNDKAEADTELQKEIPPIAPPGGATKERRHRKTKAEKVAALSLEFSDEVATLTNDVLDACPSVQPEGGLIRTDPGLLGSRLEGILAQGTGKQITPEILLCAWRLYLESHPKFVKAPQYFFGKQDDQKPDGANWHPWARVAYRKLHPPVLEGAAV
jgi:hypothetical protein